jgi:predicted NBD/HSP70 family sugar kinase
VGAGIVLNGELFQGDGFGAGEIGHLTVVDGGQLCRCGNFGCLETLVSTHAMTAHARSLAAQHPESLLNNLHLARELDIDAINHAFQSGDAAAGQLVLETGRYVGMAVANLVGALNVKHVVLMGELARLGSPLLESVRQEMLRRSLPSLARATCIDLVEMNPHVVILGASALLLMHELGLSLTR